MKLKSIILGIGVFISLSLHSQEYFEGTLIYSAKATGEPQAAELFNSSQADEVVVAWSEEGFEQREKRGWNTGKIIYRFETEKSIFCSGSKKKTVKAALQDLGKTDPKVKAFMPQMFEYELVPTNKTEEIAGYKCKKFRVEKSGFIKKEATAFVWISEEINLSPSQYKFDTEWRQIIAILPLQFGFKEGAILKAEISEPSYTGNGKVNVTYEVVSIESDEFPDNFLKIPAGYTE